MLHNTTCKLVQQPNVGIRSRSFSGLRIPCSERQCVKRASSTRCAVSAKMKYVQLGSSDLEVSEVCLGTMTYGRQNTEEEGFELMDYAHEKGVNFFDMAELYPVPMMPSLSGTTETIVGKWMKSRNSRDKTIIATKVLGAFRNCDFGGNASAVVANRHVPPLENPPQALNDKKNITEAVEGSLRRLQTTYIDLYQLHWPDRRLPLWGEEGYVKETESEYTSFEEQIEAMADLIKQGKIRHWGVCSETSFGITKFCELAKNMGLPPPVSIQNDFSLVNRKFQTELAETCSSSHCNVGLMAYGPLGGGTLTGKYMNGQKPKGARHVEFPAFQTRYTRPGTFAAVEKYAELAQRKGLTPATLALAFCKRQFFLASTMIGATKMEHLKENIEAFGVDLDEETLMEIEKIHAEDRNPAWC